MNDGIFSLREFYNRGVIKLAPDALVYIGGSLTTQVLVPVSNPGTSLSYNGGITAINVNNTIENPGASTAAIEVTTPIYGPNSQYWIQYPGTTSDAPVRVPIFIPMMEVKIFFKGRFMVDGSPKYYLSFWGFINHVEESYSGGVYKISLSCADILHWWSYSTINVHPNVESNIVSGNLQKLTVYSTTFDRSNPFQVISTLNKFMGMSQFVTPAWAAQSTPMDEIYPKGTFTPAVLGQINDYWNSRFSNTSNLLKMYGLGGQRVDQNGLELITPNGQVINTAAVSDVQAAAQPLNKDLYELDDSLLRNFTLFFDFSKMGDFSASEYMTKLEMAITVKNRCHYEFFQDVNGNFVFKPPFYNLNVKGMLPYTILPSDILNANFGVDAEGITTVMTVTTSFAQNLYETPFGKGVGLHMDIDLAKKYGVRPGNKHIEFITDPNFARTLALGYMAEDNAKTLSGTIQIPGRPEMRMGYPVYIEHRDSFNYVKSISHAFDYGGSFVTTLGLEMDRRKVYTVDEKTSQWNLLQDYVYRLDSTVTPSTIPGDAAGIPAIYASTQQTGNNVISITQGGYKEDIRQTSSERVVTQTTVPLTDEDGYRVVGSFLYGRGLNALCIDSKEPPSVLKDVYLTTMARPVYSSESDAMDVLFFDGQEGAVPAFFLPPQGTDNEMPTVLGSLSDTPPQQENLPPPPPSVPNLDSVTNAFVGPPRPTASQLLSNQPKSPTVIQSINQQGNVLLSAALNTALENRQRSDVLSGLGLQQINVAPRPETVIRQGQ